MATALSWLVSTSIGSHSLTFRIKLCTSYTLKTSLFSWRKVRTFNDLATLLHSSPRITHTSCRASSTVLNQMQLVIELSGKESLAKHSFSCTTLAYFFNKKLYFYFSNKKIVQRTLIRTDQSPPSYQKLEILSQGQSMYTQADRGPLDESWATPSAVTKHK